MALSLSARLDQAREQYHLLITGQSPSVYVDGGNGERVEYRPASVGRLAAYVAALERELAGQQRPATITPSTSKGLDQ
mgnify:CR=1 FL=1